MDERERQRTIRHRLAINRHAEEVTGNFSRPHGNLGGQTPYERLRSKARTST